MPSETQVRVTGNAENIHIQRDPMRGRRGYYTRGWTPASREAWPFQRPPYNSDEDCESCKGRMIVLDEQVNVRRSHYMRWHMCRVCGGSGRKQDESHQRQDGHSSENKQRQANQHP